MKPDLPVWRTLLYVPVNVEKYVDKAHTRGADCIQLDLEDSVPAAEKDEARTLVQAAAARVRRGGADVVVRINSPYEVTVKDLDLSVCEEVDGIAITKTQSADHVKRIDDYISGLEAKRGLRPGHTRLIAMIETPAAFFKMPAIARSSARLVAMNIGGEDFALESGMEPTEETLLMPKQQMIFAARAGGLILKEPTNLFLAPQFLRVEGRLGPFRAGVPSDARSGRGGDPLLEQLRSLPISREADPPLRHERARGSSAAGLRGRALCARLDPRRGPLRGN